MLNHGSISCIHNVVIIGGGQSKGSRWLPSDHRFRTKGFEKFINRYLLEQSLTLRHM